jgi:DNA-binding transcriptional LysR family regulator
VLDLRLLHQAITLASYRNYARAAQALHMSQPALSRSIAGLEAQLGEKLFNRTSRGVEPTAFGEMLLSRAQPLLDGATELERDFSLMRGLEVGQLRVGVGAYPAQMSVGKAIGLLLSRHPNLRIEVMSDDLRAIIDAVLAAKLDLAVIELSLAAGEPRLATEALPRHPAYFYCRAGHPVLAEKDPTIEQILKFPLAGTRMPPRVARDFLELAKAGAIDPDTGDYLPPVKADSIGMVKDVVLTSDAVAVAPIAFIEEEVALRKLVPLRARAAWMQTGYGFVSLQGTTASPAAVAFKDAVRSAEDEIISVEKQVNSGGAA